MSSVTLSPEEALVQRWLESIGIAAQKLPEHPSSPTCDFRAEDPDSLYWIEVKTRTGDDVLRAELRERGEAYRSRTTGYHSTMAAILDDAVKQLTASSAEEPGFLIAWLLFTDPGSSDLHFEQFVATVFGTVDVWDMALGERAAKPCYFFGESVFFKHKVLDAAVGLDHHSGQYTLCVNSCAPSRLLKRCHFSGESPSRRIKGTPRRRRFARVPVSIARLRRPMRSGGASGGTVPQGVAGSRRAMRMRL